MNPFSGSVLLLRRRGIWEAADSGVLLWRKNFFCFIPFFALPVTLVACGLRFLPGNLQFLSFFSIWWLKPLFDRLALNVVSVRFFASREKTAFSFRDIRKGLWGMRRGLLGDLLWRRFSPGRAARMPIRVLERINGERFRQRKRTLNSGGLAFCSFVTVLCFALEAFLLLSKITFVAVAAETFFPSGFFDRVWSNDELVATLIFTAFCFNYIFVGSLYVCMGFGLYINSRMEVEGWDLQLLFQKFAAGSAASKLGTVAVLFFCFFLILPQPAYADLESQAETRSFSEELRAPDAESLKILEDILASPDFGFPYLRDGWGIRFRERERPEPVLRVRPPAIDRQILGYMLRAIAVLAVAGLAGLAVYWYLKSWRKKMFRPKSDVKIFANPLFSTESPEMLFVGAEDFFRQGNQREAWAACLAGCIGACEKYRSLSFPADATEYGCLALARRAMPAEAEGFENVVRNWVLFAYGGRPPSDRAFEEALVYGRSLLEAPAHIEESTRRSFDEA